jgi:hypothetical protein
MNVSIPSIPSYRVSLSGGVKQLHRRQLPTQARLGSYSKTTHASTQKTTSKHKRDKVGSNRKRTHAIKATSKHDDVIITPSRRLNMLRRQYTRRGVPVRTTLTPPPLAVVEMGGKKQRGVSKISLVGAKRSYIKLDVPSDVEYESDSSDSCLSLSSSSVMEGNYQRCNPCLVTNKRRTRSVQFASLCSVVEIPNHCEYNKKQKVAMWNSCKKIRSMAKRNALEFQYDGWSVNAASEESMFVKVDGKLVHPVYASESGSTSKS